MKNKLTKYGMMIVAAVLLVAMAFAGAASALYYVAEIKETGVQYTTVEAAYNAASSGLQAPGQTIQLIADSTLTGFVSISKNVTLDLNGYTLTAASGTHMFSVNGNKIFTLNDTSVGKTGKLTGGRGTSWGGCLYAQGGTIVMNGGTITNCSTTNNGGAVAVVGNNHQFIMNGGNITNCSAGLNGGGVYIAQGSATFNMCGGTISECSATNTGNGVFFGMSYNGAFTMNNTALIDANNDVCLFSSSFITLGTNGFASGNYGAKNITVDSPSIGTTVVSGGASNLTNFALSPALSSTYILKASGSNIVLAEKPTSYGISITNATGTYELTSALTTVYGDDPATDGTAVLTFENSKPVLTLTGFKASNTTGNVPIINADVDDLTIVLNGESNLTGKCTISSITSIGTYRGLVNAAGNLTIQGGNGEQKLIVTNNDSVSTGLTGVVSIYAANNLTISSAKINATAIMDTVSYTMGCSILTKNTLRISQSVINATAIGNNAYAIYAKDGIGSATKGSVVIDGNSQVELNCYSNGVISSLDVYDDLIITSGTLKAIAYCDDGTSDINALYSRGNISISGADTVVEAKAFTNKQNAYAIRANKNLNIASAKKVNASAETQAPSGYNYAYGLYASQGSISISDSDDVTATAIAPNVYAKAIHTSDAGTLDQNITITNAKVTATAQGYSETAAIQSKKGNVTIGQNSVIEANANSTNSEAYSIYAEQNLDISSAKIVNATAEISSSQYAYGLYSNWRNITIADSPDVRATAIATSGGSANPIMLANFYLGNLGITNSTVIATGHGSDDTYALYSVGKIEIIGSSSVELNATSMTGDAYAISAGMGDLIIDSALLVNANAESNGNNAGAVMSQVGNVSIRGSDTVINAKSTCPSGSALTITAGNVLMIDSLKSMTSIGITTSGTATSFAYLTGSCDVTGLSDYTFSNASVSGAEPNSYTAFTDNWHYDSGMSAYCSNFTAVKIEKGSGLPASIKVTVSGTNAGTDPVNLTLTPVSTGTSGTYDIGTNTTYTIKPVTPGVYSFDAIYTHDSMEHKLTKQVTVTTSNRTDVTFDLLTTNVTTKVNTNQATSAPNVAVDGLDTVAKTIQPAAGQMVIISLGVDGTSGTSTADQQMLKSNRTYSAGTPSFINFTVTNTTSYVNGTVISNSTLDNLSTVLTIYVAYDMTRDNIEVFRIHNGTVENFTETSTMPTTPSDRTFFKGSSGIYIYTQKFSTYMISSTGPSSPVTPSSGGSSSSHHSGSSQLAKSQDVYVTPEPTVVPTQAQSTVIPTPAATSAPTQPTQSSPAPIAGIIAGLGAAALVLSRLRK